MLRLEEKLRLEENWCDLGDVVCKRKAAQQQYVECNIVLEAMLNVVSSLSPFLVHNYFPIFSHLNHIQRQHLFAKDDDRFSLYEILDKTIQNTTESINTMAAEYEKF